MTSGRDLTRYSGQSCSTAPPRSATVSSRCWSMVPMAPSRTRTRVARASKSAFWRSANEVMGFWCRPVSFYSLAWAGDGFKTAGLQNRSLADSCTRRGKFCWPKESMPKRAEVQLPALSHIKCLGDREVGRHVVHLPEPRKTIRHRAQIVTVGEAFVADLVVVEPVIVSLIRSQVRKTQK